MIILKILGSTLLGILWVCAGALFNAIPVFFLWNWLMPELFGLSSITLIQSVGISLLCGCLFKSHESNKGVKK